MKNIHILKGILVAFLALQFFACENEPLEGDFPPREEEPSDSTQVKFEALIDGERFVATTHGAVISEENYLVLSGAKTSGEKIVIKIPNVSQGTFPLTGGEDDRSAGLYYPREQAKPYTTHAVLGGEGEIKIDSINSNFHKISGTFNINGVRPELDAMGNPVLDENGDPIVHNVAVTEGVFSNIGYRVETDPGNSGTNTGNHDFFTKVEGDVFQAKSIKVKDTVIAGIPIIQVNAKNQHNDLIRIDIPKRLNAGTYAMESISNGTKLIGFYKAIEGEMLTSNPGTLIIEEMDRERGILHASFRFSAKDPLGINNTRVNISEGSMKIYFEGVAGGNNAFSAEIDGNSYIANVIDVSEDMVNDRARYNIETSFNNQIMILSFPKTVSEGNTYTMRSQINYGNETNAVYSRDNGETIYTSPRGEFTVTSLDRENGVIKGTFWFDAVDITGTNSEEFSVRNGQLLISLP